ncbi:MAG TPA: lipoate--protein ligase family protein, partial [Castellaniella sp.]|nr:lipoate--protein ligase family protein [Castellaniella sp.]
AAKRVDPLRSQTGLSREAVVQSMIDTFRSLHSLRNGSLLSSELAIAQALVQGKFDTHAWQARVP